MPEAPPSPRRTSVPLVEVFPRKKSKNHRPRPNTECKVNVRKGILRFEIGVATLKFAVENHPSVEWPQITDADAFASEVANMMERDDPAAAIEGDTHLQVFLDDMINRVINAGSLNVAER